jgi:cell division protein FtsI (penicillin-binding protein 3)
MNRSGNYRRITPQGGSRLVSANQARLRAERDAPLRRVDAVVQPDALAFRARAGAVLSLFAVGFVAVVARAGWLAVGPDERLGERLAAQHERIITVAPQRGNIVDRLGRPLATSVDVQSVFADPALVEDASAAAGLLSPILGSDAVELRALLSRPESRFVWLARQVPDDTAAQVRDLDLPGVRLVPEARREYPGGPLLAQVLGFVGADGGGLEGLEARFDGALMGSAYQFRVLRDGLRRAVNHDAVLSRRSTEGSTLVLGIDRSIQHRAEASLQAAIERHEANAGWMLVMDVKSGAVLAMVSLPSFDPNQFRGVPRDRFRNRPATEVFEPGSTMKAFVVAEALEEKQFKAQDVVYCENGAYRIGRRTVHDAHPHGNLTVDEIIKYSSNIGTTKLGESLGPQRIEQLFRRFGFGRRTGIELAGEEAGILHPASSWSRIGMATHCFGQGMAVTSMQLASAYAALVNGGLRVKPWIVAELRNMDGAVVEDRRPARGEERVLSAETSAEMRRMLGLVLEEGGTGTRAVMAEYTAGGKTGTAQKVKDGRYAPGLYTSSFVGFAPKNDPRLVALVVLDEPKKQYYGGTVAAPVFAEVVTHALHELGVQPDRAVPLKFGEAGTEAGGAAARREDAAADLPMLDVRAGNLGMGEELRQNGDGDGDGDGDGSEVAGVDDATFGDGGFRAPDLRGMSARDAVSALNGLGLAAALSGSGRVFQQSPPPGAALAEGDLVRLALAMRGESRDLADAPFGPLATSESAGAASP